MNKEFLKKLILGLAGVVALYFLRNEGGALRFLALAAFLFAGYHLLPIFISFLFFDLPSIILNIVPKREKKKPISEKWHKWMEKAMNVLFPISLVLLITQITKIDNTIYGLKLFWISGAIGVLMGFVFVFILNIIDGSLLEYSEGYIVVILVSFFVLFPGVVSLTNTMYATNKITCLHHRVIRKDMGGRRNRVPYIFVDIDGEDERFEVYESIYEHVIEGGEIKLCTRKGFWGYDVVETFNPIIAQPKPDK